MKSLQVLPQPLRASLVAILAAGLPLAAGAAPDVYESFDYVGGISLDPNDTTTADAPLIDTGNGNAQLTGDIGITNTTKSQVWMNNAMFDVSAGLNFTDGNGNILVTNGSAATFRNARGWDGNFSTTLAPSGGTVYSSFLFNSGDKDGGSGNEWRFLFRHRTDSGAAIGMGLGEDFGGGNGANPNWMVSAGGSGNVDTGFAISENTTYLFVTKMVFDFSGIMQLVDVWGFEAGSGNIISEAAAGAANLYTAVGVASGNNGLTHYETVRNNIGTTQEPTIDEIRYGSTWEDVIIVVPEPSTTSLVIMSSLAFFGWRRSIIRAA